MPVSAEKEEYAKKLNKLLDTYSKVLFVGMDNVTSQQVHAVRRDLRNKGVLLMGKKTLQKRIITNRAEEGNENDRAMKSSFVDDKLLTTNRGMLFTDLEIPAVAEILAKHRVQAPARVGAVAPCDVIVPAGNTGMEPTMTSFFQALNIATKISKGTVEIVSDKKVLNQGEKVDNSTAALLQKLKISPFFYAVEIQYVWDRGVLFTPEDLQTTDAKIEEWLLAGISNMTALSLGAGVPTEASFPHTLLDAFKNLLAISVETNYEFTEFNGKQLRNDIKSGKTSAPSKAPEKAAPEKAAAAPKKEEKAPEPEEEEDFGMAGLF
jgi:large subunit ribosomal protein LP0